MKIQLKKSNNKIGEIKLMKLLVTMVALLLGMTTIAQQDIERNLGDFNEIKVYDLINVELVKDDINKAIISGDNTSDVEILNKNGTLKIKMRFGQNFEGNKTVVTLHYRALNIIDGNEGSYISSKDVIQQPSIDLRAQEGAIIQLQLNMDDAKIKAVTGGEIEVSGRVRRQDISLNTGGIFQGKTLESETTYVAIRAAGDAYINASLLADVKIRAGGNVYIYGHPEQINESKILGGRIQQMD